MTCPEHKIGNPKCEDCWKALFKLLNEHNVGMAMDDSTKYLIDNARKKRND